MAPLLSRRRRPRPARRARVLPALSALFVLAAGLRAEVTRPERVRVQFQDLGGESVELETGGMLARVIQHELDHCEGILFTDRLSPARRMLLKKRLADIEREYAPRQ